MNETKRKIWLVAGYPEVIENGFFDFNIDKLSDKIKIAKTSFYHYYHSKEMYLNELINYWATEKWVDIKNSLNLVIKLKSAEAFVKHKSTYIDFYCFHIRLKRSNMVDEESNELTNKIEKHFTQFYSDFVKSLRIELDTTNELLKMFYTYCSGWDYLYAFDVYYKTKIRKKALAELRDFFKTQISTQSLKQVS